MPQITVTANSIIELKQILLELTTSGEVDIETDPEGGDDMLPSRSRPSRAEWESFKGGVAASVKGVLDVIDAVERSDGFVSLTEIEDEVDIDRGKLRGVLSHVQRASKRVFGAPLFFPRPWKQLPDGRWDRDYLLNPHLYPPVPPDSGAEAANGQR